jgi:hypothetical protein
MSSTHTRSESHGEQLEDLHLPELQLQSLHLQEGPVRLQQAGGALRREMKTLTRSITVLILVALATEATGIASVGARKADYVGGTVPALAAASSMRINGTFVTSDTRALIFNGVEAAQTIRIPYANITDIEYGQKAGRRMGPVGLVTRLSKKRAHFLTIEFTAADGATEVALFEIGKDLVKPMLIELETRSNKKTVFQDPSVEYARGW